MTVHSHSENLQLTPSGNLQHFVAIKGLPAKTLKKILDTADGFIQKNGVVKKPVKPLSDITVANLFFENSTRTRSTFELAEKKLGLTVLNLHIQTSSTQKGETLLDTVRNLKAMGVNLFVIRHPENGAPLFIAKNIPGIKVINAGDGSNEHPTQAILDMLTIRHHKKDFTKLRVAIVGDVLHSRVARSAIYALTTLGAHEIRVIAPRTLLPTEIENLGVTPFDNLETGIRDVDVIMALRLQEERMQNNLMPDKADYFQRYGLTAEKLSLAKPNVIVMHPGPVNRGVEMDSEVLDGKHSVVLQQVQLGIPARMAIMSLLLK